jgi:hypothetical protein
MKSFHLPFFFSSRRSFCGNSLAGTNLPKMAERVLLASLPEPEEVSAIR